MIKPTITIATTAFNEQKNIVNFLKGVLAQQEINFELKEIIVISDGSTDNTYELASTFKDLRIRVFKGKVREGKPVRLNQIIDKFESEILVLLDSDIFIDDELVISKLVRKFNNDETLYLIGGNPLPLQASNILEEGINNYFYSRNLLRKGFHFDTSPYASRGAILALKRKFAKKINLPKNILVDDAYIYFACKFMGYKFMHEEEAIVWYQSPKTLKDYINQSIRYLKGRVQLQKYFGKRMVDSGYFIPRDILVAILLVQIAKNPFAYFLLKIVNIYCIFYVNNFQSKLNARWSTILSSKDLSFNNK